jgi:hypothetical protein
VNSLTFPIDYRLDEVYLVSKAIKGIFFPVGNKFLAIHRKSGIL